MNCTARHSVRWRPSPLLLATTSLVPLLIFGSAGSASAQGCSATGDIVSSRCDSTEVDYRLGVGDVTLTVDSVTSGRLEFIPSNTVTGPLNATLNIIGTTKIDRPDYSAVLFNTDGTGRDQSSLSVFVGPDVELTSAELFGAIFLNNRGTGFVSLETAGTVLAKGDGQNGIWLRNGEGSILLHNSGDVTSERDRGLYADGNGLVNAPGGGAIEPADVRIINSGNVKAATRGIRTANWRGLSSIENSGTVEARRNQGLVTWSREGTSSITNSGTVISRDNHGIQAIVDNGNATITNSGMVTSRDNPNEQNETTGQHGLFARANQVGDIAITNTVEGRVDAIEVGIRGAATLAGRVDIEQAGHVTAAQQGIQALSADGAVSVTNSGIVTSAWAGVELDGTTNSLVNSGAVTSSSTPDATIVTGDGDSTIRNSGVIANASGTEAIMFGNGTNRLILDVGTSVIDGVVQGGTGDDHLVLDVETEADLSLLLIGASGQFRGFEFLEKTGDGILTVAGDGTGFSGTTHVRSGSLRLDGTLGDARSMLVVADAGTLTGSGSIGGDAAFSGMISPGNSIGVLSVAGDASFHAGSVLRAEIDGSGASDTLVIANTVTIDVDATVDVIGLGDLGDLPIQSTHILIDNRGSQPIGGGFAPGAGRLGSDGAFFSLLSLTGGDGNDLEADVFRTGLSLSDGKTSSETVTFPAGFPGFTFTVEGTNSATFAGGLNETAGSPLAVTKAGSGTLTLSGTNGFTGGLTIMNGTLLNTGTLASVVTVNRGGVFGGTGTSGGLVANAGSTVAPGNSIGTLTVAGNAAFNEGSTLRAEVAPDGTTDLLSVDGTASIATKGTTLDVRGLPGDFPLIPPTYTVLRADGGVTGQFATVQDNLPDIDFVQTLTTNEMQLGYVLAGSDFSPKQIHPSTLGASMQGALLFGNTLRRRGGLVVGQMGGGAGNGSLLGFVEQPASAGLPAQGLTAAMPGLPSGALWAPQDGWTVWGTVLGSDLSVDADGATPGWDAQTGGLAFGVERHFEGLAFPALAGLAVGYSRSSVSSGASDADVDAFHIGAYAAAQAGALTLSGALSYAWQDYDFERAIPFAGTRSIAEGDTDGRSFVASAEAFYDISQHLGTSFHLGPLATINAVHGEQDRFTESGVGILNLRVDGTTADQLFTGLGVGFGLNRAVGTTLVSLDGRVAWEHVLGDRSITTISAIPVANAVFSTGSAPISRDRLAIGVGAAIAVNDNVSTELRYDGAFARTGNDHQGSASLTIRF